MSHFKNECPIWERGANYAKLEEDVLLMAHIAEETENMWYLDSCCSNHMCGTKWWFSEFDGSFRQQVKLGDNIRMQVEGNGILMMEIIRTTQVISSLYFVLGLRNNLLTVGQLQQMGLKIVIEDYECRIWHKEQKRVIMQSKMFINRMFVI